MTILISVIIIAFIGVLQAAIPYLLKNTIVFGVTIPSNQTNHSTLSSYKKYYSATIFSISLISLLGYLIYTFSNQLSDETIILTGVALQFAILFASMALYFYFHAKTSLLKREQKWGSDLKQVKITDLAVRSADEMLPWTIYLLPIFITIGLIIYTFTQYTNLPDLIPTHWGIDGQPDAFTVKTPFSVFATLLILLMMQGMILGINEMTKKSGIKINAVNKNRSRAQQLSFRKYTSWFLFVITLLMTVLFCFLQINMIHENIVNPALMLALSLGFFVTVLALTAIYAFKVGQGGSRLEVNVADEEVEGITNFDDDRFWKLGVIYVNKNDPSVFVEKRFGVGWTINLGRPTALLIIFLPLIIILTISLLI
jgi:uncharacterized membrane protein